MDVALVRKRIQKAIEVARRESADRRTRAQEAEKEYEEFLETRAIPAFRSVAIVLKSEGLNWEVMTPSAEVRLVPGRRRDEYIAITFDAINLMNEKIVQFSGVSDRPRAIYDNGRQFYFGVRFRY